ncbi:MAG: right-handed parallel beta-helix repeat-containing protein [Armatimonadetes bacterium]|nr:right-handed parallel beta-helix repeat-containing protein [Armatimonadota bacterium]
MNKIAADFFVSNSGNDVWSGRLPEPDTAGTDGPFATVTRARDAVREQKMSGATVWIRGGRYPISEPICFGPDDSSSVTYVAYPGEEPIIDGGRRIEGWTIQKLGALHVWVADIPEVAQGKWYFRELFVNGERRSRARFPKEGFYRIESVPGIDLSAALFEGSDAFKCAPGDIRNWHNLKDVEIVALHWWVEERMPIESFDEVARLVKSSRRSIFALKDDQCREYARYYVENVFEALSEPGEWYLDRSSGKLFYVPLPEEDAETTEVFAPRITEFLKIVGHPDEEKYVENLRFDGLTFRHADWVQPSGGSGVPEDTTLPNVEYAAAAQAAANVPGAIYLNGASECTIENCRIEHFGWYGIELAEGCTNNHIIRNNIWDGGAGGVKMNGSDADGSARERTGNNRVTDNHIHSCGRVFHSAIGIMSMHSFGNQIAHNHIHDIYYSGISCGWVWAYEESVSKNNRIEKNHIHDIGHGLLSDMGGIYTLGVQPGTVLSGNLIHDIEARNYGGWAIYLDQSSSHMLIRDNICYNASSLIYHQNSVRSNVVRNNIFAFGSLGLVGFGTGDVKEGDEIGDFLTLQKNILITEGQPVIMCFGEEMLEERGLFSDLNLLWDVSNQPLVRGYMDSATFHDRWRVGTPILQEEWNRMGYDRHSIVADPGFKNLAQFDFTLQETSAALILGFRPIDMSDVGPRPRDKR